MYPCPLLWDSCQENLGCLGHETSLTGNIDTKTQRSIPKPIPRPRDGHDSIPIPILGLLKSRFRTDSGSIADPWFIGFRKRPILGRKSAKETLGQQLRKKLGVGLEGPRRAFNALRNHDRAVTQKMKANLRANLKEPSFNQVLWQSLRPLFS